MMRLAGFFDFLKPKFIPVVAADDETIQELDTFYQELQDKIHDQFLETWELQERHKEQMKAFSVREQTMWREIEKRYGLPDKAVAYSFESETKKLGYYK